MYFDLQKHKRSPRIKTALSQTALESVKSGGAAKKIRTTASARKLQTLHDENYLMLSARGSMSTSTLSTVDPKNMVVLSALATNNRLRRKSNPSPTVDIASPKNPSIIVRQNFDKDLPILTSASKSVDVKQESTSSLRRQAASSGSLAAAAVGKRILKQQLKSQSNLSTSGNAKPVGAFR